VVDAGNFGLECQPARFAAFRLYPSNLTATLLVRPTDQGRAYPPDQTADETLTSGPYVSSESHPSELKL
jgi:hypothetical protein